MVNEKRLPKNESASKEQEMNAIVNELDDLLIDQLQLVDVYTKSVVQEEKLFKDGLMNIAHARMCMIPNMISTAGLLKEDNSDTIFPVAASTVMSKGDDQPQCHRVLSVDTKKDKELLNMFGKNIPSSLKRAQTSFQHVLENVIDRANILSKMDFIYQRSCELRGKSQRPLTDAAASGTDKENIATNINSVS